MIIAIAGQKGGVGKTTIAVHLATEWLDRGRRVLLVDADPQGSSRTWADVASEFDLAVPTVVSMGESLYKPDQLPSLAQAHDVTLIDCPPRLDAVQRAAMTVADMVVLPATPSPIAVWALSSSLELVQSAAQVRELAGLRPLDAAILIACKDARTALGRGMRDELGSAGLELLDCELGARVAFAESLAHGSTATRYAPKSQAAQEVRELASELECRTEERLHVA